MGFDGFEDIIGLNCKKILIYHNITPEKYIEDEYTKKYIRIGLQQLEQYKNYVDYAIADSNYNRKDMINRGYRYVDILPVHISLNRFEKLIINNNIVSKYSKTTNILFVGRVFNNKCQQDVIKAFSQYHNNYNENSLLFLVGDNSNQRYNEYLSEVAISEGVSDRVIYTGKVSEEDLKSYYEIADIFLCMSEHEGFGVPLLEAMKMEVPVLAYDSSAIAETMDKAGVLFEKKDFIYIAEKMNDVLTNEALNNEIINNQNIRIKRIEQIKTKEILLSAINNIQNNYRETTLQVQGPFETSYSLAIVNRKLSEAIHKQGKYNTSIYCTEGPGDYEPSLSNLIDKPLAKELYEKSKNYNNPDITIRNMWPPRVHDVCGGLNFQAFGWEESKVPVEIVENFNKYLDGIGTTSSFVTSSLKKSGLAIPVKTMGNGVELPSNYAKLKPYKLKSTKNIKFIHISSCFPRKGVDILLETYYKTFTDKDDVCLVIKTFPNPHNDVEKLINELNKQYCNSPEVELINKDLPDEELYSLYKIADCYVHVARGEGFGLPVAEAMLAKVPVIVSNNSGLADFCNENNSLLVDYEVAPAKTHLASKDSMWFEPNCKTLSKHMFDFVYKRETLNIEEKTENAYNLISTEYTWDMVSKRWDNFIELVFLSKTKINVDMVTTWNSKCGIAEYSKFLCNQLSNYINYNIYPNYGVKLLDKEDNITKERLWHSCFEGNVNNLIEVLNKSNSEVIHVQFNFGFFKLAELSKLINELSPNKRILITFHSIKDAMILNKKVSLGEISDSLNKVKNIVHQEIDVELLQSMGVKKENINIIPLGQVEVEQFSKRELRNKLGLNRSLILGSYGFLLPQKGFRENLSAIKDLKKKYPDILYILSCSLFDDKISHEYYEECVNYVIKNNLQGNVLFVTDFLPNDESNVLLQLCDACLMTYLPTNESASGAIRMCIAAQLPIIVTEQDIFKEFRDCTYQIKTNTPQNICDAVEEVLKNSNTYIEKVRQHIKKTSWDVVGERYYEEYTAKFN